MSHMGVGLRLSGIASEELGLGRELQAFKEYLRAQGLYVFTINGFPYGPFHGTRVKEDVYQPDWRFPERLTYSNRLADQLAVLLPDDASLDGSVSTVPATFRPIGGTSGALEQIAENVLQHAAHLVGVKRRTGRTITIALEPEPMCYLETSDELIAFMEQRIFSKAAVQRFSQISGIAGADAEDGSPATRGHMLRRVSCRDRVRRSQGEHRATAAGGNRNFQAATVGGTEGRERGS